jgi:hypothetical protein
MPPVHRWAPATPAANWHPGSNLALRGRLWHVALGSELLFAGDAGGRCSRLQVVIPHVGHLLLRLFIANSPQGDNRRRGGQLVFPK